MLIEYEVTEYILVEALKAPNPPTLPHGFETLLIVRMNASSNHIKLRSVLAVKFHQDVARKFSIIVYQERRAQTRAETNCIDASRPHIAPEAHPSCASLNQTFKRQRAVFRACDIVSRKRVSSWRKTSTTFFPLEYQKLLKA